LDAFGRFTRMQLGHARMIQVLPASHRVREMHSPTVAFIHVGHGRGDTAFRHDRVRFAQQ
jgi:hypothetical protein